MKKIVNFFLALFIVLGLASCNDKTATPEKTPTGEITNPSENPTGSTDKTPTQEENTKVEATVDNIQDGTVLHAWNWSMTTIKSKMAEIKDESDKSALVRAALSKYLKEELKEIKEKQ